jgi:hypothetical protein
MHFFIRNTANELAFHAEYASMFYVSVDTTPAINFPNGDGA